MPRIRDAATVPLVAMVLSLVTAGLVSANNHAEPGMGPPDCPGMPGAFISSEAQDLIEQETPPGTVVSQIAQAPDGRGVGDEVKDALVEDCGVGALPQED